MKPESEQALVRKYPELFRNRTKSPKESLMCFGCECGDGWRGILDNLFGYLCQVRESHCHMIALKPEFANDSNDGYLDLCCPPVVLDQIKEKYGTLRVYWHFDTEDLEKTRDTVKNEEELDRYVERYSNLVEDAVDFAEYLSSKTCEVTGKPGKLYSDGWCVTLCEEEAKKRFGWVDNTSDPSAVQPPSP